MKTRRTTWKQQGTGNAYRPKHRRMAYRDDCVMHRHRERQILERELKAELKEVA